MVAATCAQTIAGGARFIGASPGFLRALVKLPRIGVLSTIVWHSIECFGPYFSTHYTHGDPVGGRYGVGEL